MTPDIYAVIWCDFVPLHLKFGTAQEAIDHAVPMRERVKALGMFMDIRAVHLAPDDTITDLIEREELPQEVTDGLSSANKHS